MDKMSANKDTLNIITKDPGSSWGTPKILSLLGHQSLDTAPPGIDSVSPTTGETGSEPGSPGTREVSQI